MHPLHPPPRSAPATTTCSDQLHFHGEIGEELNRLFSPPGVSTSRLVAFSRFHFAHKEMSQAKAINSAVLNLLYRYLMWNTQTKESLSRLRALSDLPRPPASSPIHLPTGWHCDASNVNTAGNPLVFNECSTSFQNQLPCCKAQVGLKIPVSLQLSTFCTVHDLIAIQMKMTKQD